MDDTPTEVLVRATDAISGPRRPNGWIELLNEETGEPLRALNRACGLERATAIVLADLTTPLAPNTPYARLWDRSEDFAAQLGAWADGMVPFPCLKPNELIRLPV